MAAWRRRLLQSSVLLPVCIRNEDEPPVAVAPAGETLPLFVRVTENDENLPSTLLDARNYFQDPDAGDAGNLEYTIEFVSTNNAGGETASLSHIQTDDQAGLITLGPDAFNFEDGSQYKYLVSARDPDLGAGAQAEFEVTIEVLDQNEAPEPTQHVPAVSRMVEYSTDLQAITDFSSLFVDVDEGDSLRFSVRLHDGVSGDLPFEITSQGGILSYTGPANLDFDDRAQIPSPWIDVVATDSEGLTGFLPVRLELINANFPPVAQPPQIQQSIDENVAGPIVMGQITVTDRDAGDSFTFEIIPVAGADAAAAGKFTVDAQGSVSYTGTGEDYEALLAAGSTVVEADVRVSDGVTASASLPRVRISLHI